MNEIPYLTWFEYGERIQWEISKKDWDFIPYIIEQVYCEDRYL